MNENLRRQIFSKVAIGIEFAGIIILAISAFMPFLKLHMYIDEEYTLSTFDCISYFLGSRSNTFLELSTFDFDYKQIIGGLGLIQVFFILIDVFISTSSTWMKTRINDKSRNTIKVVFTAAIVLIALSNFYLAKGIISYTLTTDIEDSTLVPFILTCVAIAFFIFSDYITIIILGKKGDQVLYRHYTKKFVISYYLIFVLLGLGLVGGTFALNTKYRVENKTRYESQEELIQGLCRAYNHDSLQLLTSTMDFKSEEDKNKFLEDNKDFFKDKYSEIYVSNITSNTQGTVFYTVNCDFKYKENETEKTSSVTLYMKKTLNTFSFVTVPSIIEGNKKSEKFNDLANSEIRYYDEKGNIIDVGYRNASNQLIEGYTGEELTKESDEGGSYKFSKWDYRLSMNYYEYAIPVFVRADA